MVIQAFAPTIGGAELQLERLLPHLAARGVETIVMTRGVPGEPRRDRAGPGMVRRTYLSGRSAFASLDFVGETFAYLLRHRRSVDVVHAHGALSEGTVALLANALELPTVVTVLGTGITGDFERLVRKPTGRARARRLARSGDFIALNNDVRDYLRKWDIPEERISIVPNGVDVDAFRPADESRRARLRAELRLPEGPVAVFSGRLVPAKRVDLLLHALGEVPNLRVVILGDGPERSRLESLSHELGHEGRVSFRGFTRQVGDYLAAADLFAFPSDAEGLSNALLEAMACGLACLSGPSGGAPDLFEGDCGLVVPPDPTSWAHALRRIVEDDALRRMLGENAATRARSSFGFDAVADRLVEVYTSAVSRQNRTD
jgi:glycosyltransferase involved in cell wall biosynthesis